LATRQTRTKSKSVEQILINDLCTSVFKFSLKTDKQVVFDMDKLNSIDDDTFKGLLIIKTNLNKSAALLK